MGVLSEGETGFTVVVGPFSGVLLRVRLLVSFSSGIVANCLRTCLSAGRRMGLLVDVSRLQCNTCGMFSLT